ncbi:thioredoxin family protein [Mesorhizobium xinjiangense]|uniref:thioredoxin family protein n=1 Tax=Mesorhizobium xinjiangense TaxID=2678685 RepID=UPI0012EDE83E|nr:thioredoxin family protein [Mesorhizobium xinjiangense]
MAAVPPVCDFGWPAVDAELPGVDGQTYRIFDLAGPGGLVVAFICNHCPYVKAVIDRMVEDARVLDEVGVGFVAVNSNDAAAYPADSFDKMKLFAERHRLFFPYLHDEDQKLARAYGAACTPDLFGFNADMKLQYRGRLDEAGRNENAEGARRDLVEAMRQIARTGEGPEDQVASIGCSIKWKQDV